MLAKFVKPSKNARNFSREKEQIASYTVVALDDASNMLTPITVRCWMGRSRNASTVHATIWVSHAGVFASGTGRAGGWGYHKISAAIDDAIRAAGIELYGSPYSSDHEIPIDSAKRASIHGVGEMAIELALQAIAHALGFTGTKLIVKG